ncbi:MAG: FeoA family protein [Gammaproteobacteria bacterium]
MNPSKRLAQIANVEPDHSESAVLEEQAQVSNDLNIRSLDQMELDVPARITSVGVAGKDHDFLDELGIHAGNSVRVFKRAPIFQDPIAVYVGSRLVSVRRHVARRVQVQIIDN